MALAKTYTSEHGSFRLSLTDTKEEGLVTIWTLLQPKINSIRDSLDTTVFNSAFSKEELQVLNLKANSDIFPMLINKDGDLRERVQKTLNPKSTKKPWENMMKRMEAKAKTFRDIADAARRQEKAYVNEASTLKSTKKILPSNERMDQEDSGLKSILRASTTMPAKDIRWRERNAEEFKEGTHRNRFNHISNSLIAEVMDIINQLTSTHRINIRLLKS